MTPLQIHPRSAPVAEQPVDLLLACHERIRRFSSLAVRLADVKDAPLAELAEAARSVHRYFDVALSLHIQDEDQTLRPLLLATGDERVREALDRMFHEHVDIDAALLDLLPRWLRLAQHPESLSEESASILEPARALQRAMEAHLVQEEAVVLPAVARLAPEAQLRILRAMRERREPRSLAV